MTTIIHHGGCPDGMGAAYLLGKYIGEHTKIAAQHRDPVPLGLRDEDVYLVDFVYDDPAKMRAVLDEARSVLVLDHHQTAWGVLEQVAIMLTSDLAEGLGMRAGGLRTAVIDQNYSGAGLVQRYVEAMWPERDTDTYPPAPDGWWVKYVQDRDLWRFEFPTTQPIMSWITSFPYDDESWDIIDSTPMTSALVEGMAIERFRKQLIDDAVRRAWLAPIALDPDGLTGEVKVWHVDCPYTIGSDVAHVLAQRTPKLFAVYLVGQPNTVKYGLRSLEGGMDVAEIAERFHGGGHKHAAGFSVPSTLGPIEW